VPTSPYLLLILAALFWGGNFALGKAVSEIIPPISLSYLRWAIALIIMIPLCWSELKQHKNALLANWPLFSILGTTGVMGFNICVYLSLQYTSAINASLITSFSPAFVALISMIFIKELLSPKQWSGIALSFLGAVILIFKGNWQNLISLTFNKGDLIMLLAVVFWGIYSLFLKIRGAVLPSKSLLAASIFMGLVIAFPLAAYETVLVGPNWIYNLSAFHYASLGYFGVFPTILAFLFFNKAMLEVGPSRATVYLSLIPVFASLLGILFLNESLTLYHLAGGALIITGIFLTSQKTMINKTSENPQSITQE